MGYKKMLVFFLDIQGSKDNIGFEKKFEIHNLFHGEAKINENRQKNLSHVVYERKIYTFSDCAYIFYYYKDNIEEERKNDANLIFIAIHNTNLSILKLLSKGYFIRGGICFGEAYFDDLGFFGPAIERAYEIESKEAVYPMIMLDNNIGELVYNWERNIKKDPMLISQLIDIPYMIEKYENKYFVNILRQLQITGTQMLEDTIFDLEELKSNAIKKAKLDIERLQDDKITKKLSWMINYLNSKNSLLLPELQNKSFSAIAKYNQ